MKSLLTPLAVLVTIFISGCAQYVPPGPKADLNHFAPPTIQDGFSAKPTAPFPASVAVVRVQSPTYTNFYLGENGGKYGNGRYSVIMTREVETPEQLDRISSLPKIVGLTGLNRMLLPARLEGDREVREAAARLQADLIFLYTFDTAFFDRDAARPLTVITLGLSPTRKITAITTVSAILLDTRTGYIYATYETTERESVLASSWGSRNSADAARQENEKRAFAKLVDQVVSSWPKVLARHVDGIAANGS